MPTSLREIFGRFPVPVLRGLARGALWSAYPHSSYWRSGGNDPEVSEALREHACVPGGVFWDLGAHYGIYAVGVARKLGRGGRVEAFEPDPVSFSRLQWHKRLNRLSQLHAHPFAVSDRSGPVGLLHYDPLGATTSHLAYPDETVSGVATREVQAVALDAWVAEGRVRPPTFVKIDVEGHAAQSLVGMARTLEQHRPGILLAVHHRIERDHCMRRLATLGYSCMPVSPQAEAAIRDQAFGELLCLPRRPAE
jgi:FkbM family methyltransferase